MKTLASKFRATGFLAPDLIAALDTISPDIVAGFLLHGPRARLYAHAVAYFRRLVVGGHPRAYAMNVAAKRFSFGDPLLADRIQRQCKNPS